MALHPEREVQRLYNFLDLPYNAFVADFASSHTLGLHSTHIASTNPYFTLRNSTATVFAWRDHLPYDRMLQLQEECHTVLRDYGYRFYHSPRHYQDPQLKPLLPLPPIQ